MRALSVCVVVVAACGGKESKPDECSVVISGALDRAKPALKEEAATDSNVASVVAMMKDVMATRCREDHWSPAALACLKASTDNAAAQACHRDHLTKEQHDKLLLAVSTTHRGKESKAAPVLRKLGEFRDQMCKCSDRACIDAVSKDMEAWGMEAAKAGPAPEMRKVEKELSQKIGEEIGECTNRVLLGSAK